MGRNSRWRRDAKAAAKQRPAGAGARSAASSTVSVDEALGLMGLGAGGRRSCSACGSRDLDHGTIRELAGRIPADLQSPLREAQDIFGADAAAWHCASCGELGFLTT